MEQEGKRGAALPSITQIQVGIGVGATLKPIAMPIQGLPLGIHGWRKYGC